MLGEIRDVFLDFFYNQSCSFLPYSGVNIDRSTNPRNRYLSRALFYSASSSTTPVYFHSRHRVTLPNCVPISYSSTIKINSPCESSSSNTTYRTSHRRTRFVQRQSKLCVKKISNRPDVSNIPSSTGKHTRSHECRIGRAGAIVSPPKQTANVSRSKTFRNVSKRFARRVKSTPGDGKWLPRDHLRTQKTTHQCTHTGVVCREREREREMVANVSRISRRSDGRTPRRKTPPPRAIELSGKLVFSISALFSVNSFTFSGLFVALRTACGGPKKGGALFV